MLVKGIITNIDFANNTCSVRVPSFETAATKSEMIYDAIFAVPPGHYNGYKVGDIVICGFELTTYNDPIVIGKLYLGASTENTSARGASKISDLHVENSASLPLDTKLTSKQVQQIKNAKPGFKYDTLLDIVKEVANNSWDISNLKESKQSFSSTETSAGTWLNAQPLFKRTLSYEPGTSQIDLASLNIDTIFVDTSYSIYYTGTEGNYQSTNITNAVYDTATQKLNVPATTKTGYITFFYTKKEK